MSRNELADELARAVSDLTDDDCERELAGIVPPDELVGLALRIRVAIMKVVDRLDPRS